MIANHYLGKGDAELDLLETLSQAKRMVAYRHNESSDGLDSARASVRWLRASNLPDSRLIVCSLDGDTLFPMVMSMLAFDNQAATFAYPGATMGAMSAAAQGRAAKADEDVTELLKQIELDASFNSAGNLGFDELISPEETRNALLLTLQRAVQARQEAAAPVARTAITP